MEARFSFASNESAVTMIHPEVAQHIAHGYEDDLDNDIMWSTVETHIPVLLAEVGLLLEEA